MKKYNKVAQNARFANSNTCIICNFNIIERRDPGPLVFSNLDGLKGFERDGPSPALLVHASGLLSLAAPAGDHWALHVDHVCYSASA